MTPIAAARTADAVRAPISQDYSGTARTDDDDPGHRRRWCIASSVTKVLTSGQSRRSGELSRRRSLASWRSAGPLRRHHTPSTPAGPAPSIARRRTRHQRRRGQTRPALSMATGTALGYSVRSKVSRIARPFAQGRRKPLEPAAGRGHLPRLQDRNVLDPYGSTSHVGDLHVRADGHLAGPSVEVDVVERLHLQPGAIP